MYKICERSKITYDDLWKVHLPNLSYNLQHMDHMELKLLHKKIIFTTPKKSDEFSFLVGEKFEEGAKFCIFFPN